MDTRFNLAQRTGFFEPDCRILFRQSERIALVQALMAARRDVGAAMRANDVMAAKAARARVHDAKVALGERGPAWWSDGAPDYNRRLVKNTPYATE